jgi:glucose-1-phosphate thymidylyltransferase
MLAVLLAAGFATRMYPLTRDRAKPLLEVGGRPALDWILERALAVPGLREVRVVTNARFRAQFDEWRAALGALPVPVRVIDDGTHTNDTRLGALGDLALALEGTEDEELLVLAGDNLIDFDLAPHVARMRREGRPLLFARTIEGAVPPRRYSEIVVDAHGAVTSFREKPADPRSNLSAPALYVFPADVAAELRAYLAAGGDADAPGHFLAWLHGRRALTAVPLPGAWHDIGNLETLERARADYAERGARRP